MRRRILIVSPTLPHPPIWGFGIRVFELVQHLARGNDVTLLAHAGPEDSDKVEAMRAVCEEVRTVSLARPPGATSRAAQLASLWSPLPHHVLRVRSRELQAELNRLLACERFDLIQIESSPLAELRIDPDLPVVLDEHNIEYELLRRACETEAALPRKAFNWLEYLKLRRHEEASWGRVRAIAVTSDREARIVSQRLPHANVAVIPNGVNLEYFMPADNAVDPDSIVFTGLMSYRPNLDAAGYFAHQVLPLIRRSRPKARFTVVGWGSVEQIQAHVGPGVEVTGRVPDVRPYLRSAAVVTVPLRVGGGTRLKVLEALATARPVVSTALGCEGIDVRDGEHLLIRDDPKSQAEAVLELMAEPRSANILGQRGRNLVEQQYGWASSAGKLEALFDRVLEGRARPVEAPG
jgi:sugar transferase (PEP-CTERM/EpsH1 system associated)